jgi:hypothetical protein
MMTVMLAWVLALPAPNFAELKDHSAVKAPIQVATKVSPEVTLTLAEARTAPPRVLPSKKVEPKPEPNQAIIIAGAGASGAALIPGVVFTVLANQRTSEAREKNSELVKAMGPGTCVQPTGACAEVAGLYRERATFTNVAGWSFIGAGMLGVATVVYALAAKSAPKAGVGAALVVTTSGGGFLVGGAW